MRSSRSPLLKHQKFTRSGMTCDAAGAFCIQLHLHLEKIGLRTAAFVGHPAYEALTRVFGTNPRLRGIDCFEKTVAVWSSDQQRRKSGASLSGCCCERRKG